MHPDPQMRVSMNRGGGHIIWIPGFCTPYDRIIPHAILGGAVDFWSPAGCWGMETHMEKRMEAGRVWTYRIRVNLLLVRRLKE